MTHPSAAQAQWSVDQACASSNVCLEGMLITQQQAPMIATSMLSEAANKTMPPREFMQMNSLDSGSSKSNQESQKDISLEQDWLQHISYIYFC